MIHGTFMAVSSAVAFRHLHLALSGSHGAKVPMETPFSSVQ